MFTSFVNKSSFFKRIRKKIKEKWFRKQNKKEDETCGKENETKAN